MRSNEDLLPSKPAARERFCTRQQVGERFRMRAASRSAAPLRNPPLLVDSGPEGSPRTMLNPTGTGRRPPAGSVWIVGDRSFEETREFSGQVGCPSCQSAITSR